MGLTGTRETLSAAPTDRNSSYGQWST